MTSRYTIVIKTDSLQRLHTWLYDSRLPIASDFFIDIGMMLQDGSNSVKIARVISYLKARRLLRGKTSFESKDPEDEKRLINEIRTLLFDGKTVHTEK